LRLPRVKYEEGAILDMQIVSAIPQQGWAKVALAARAARVSASRVNQMIVAGAVPVAVDKAGYMWVSVDSLRNGVHDENHPL
jgi:hypothetical protein